jgi:predicted nucleic acid-binding protein
VEIKMYKLAYEHLIDKSVTITKELIKKCKSDAELKEVAFGQGEDRDLEYIIGSTIKVSRDESYTLFDDEHGNDYLEVTVEGAKYNIPCNFFI